MIAFLHWLWPWNALHGDGYQFWSGLGSDLAYLSVLGLAIHHLNCAEPGCWRLGHPGRRHRCKTHA